MFYPLTTFRLFLLLAFTALISGCNGSRVEELERQVTLLQYDLAATQGRLSDVESEVEILRSEVDDLNSAVE